VGQHRLPGALRPLGDLQYRRYGDWNLRRLAGTLAGCLYATALVTYTWLPLPRRDPAWCENHNLAVQLEPLMRIAEARDATAGKGLLGTLTDVTVMQLAFNVLLFVPLGVLLRGYWRRSLLVSCAAGLAVSLLIEASQATGLWGLYPCPYRTADVDDLITNTAGALLGALLAPAVLWWMPNATLLRPAGAAAPGHLAAPLDRPAGRRAALRRRRGRCHAAGPRLGHRARLAGGVHGGAARRRDRPGGGVGGGLRGAAVAEPGRLAGPDGGLADADLARRPSSRKGGAVRRRAAAG